MTDALLIQCEQCFLNVLRSVVRPIRRRLRAARPAAVSRRQVGRLAVLAAVHRLVGDGRTCTKRDLYYQHKRLFGEQAASDRCLEWVARSLGVERNELGVVASRRGLVVGDVTWTECGQRLAVRDVGATGHLVPASIRRDVSDIDVGALRAVLYVEKETVLFQLAQARVHERHALLLVTGKGFADLGTRELLHLLSARLPVYGLVDADPHGVAILAALLGTKKRRSDGSLLCPDVRWLGLRPSQIVPFAAAPQRARLFLPLTDVDRRCAAALLARADLPPAWRHEVELMLDAGVKAELEILDAFEQNCLVKQLARHFD